MASIIEGVFQTALIAVLGKGGVREFMGKIDPFQRSIISERTAISAGLGRGFIARRPIYAGESGAGRFTSALVGPDEVGGGVLAHFEGAPSTYPGYKEETHGSIAQVETRLGRLVTNFRIDFNMIRADRLDSMMVKYVEMKTKGFLHKVAGLKTRPFYKRDGASVPKIICTVDEIVAGGTTGDDFVTIRPKSASIHQFSDGQVVETWNGAGTTRRVSAGSTLDSTDLFLCVDGVNRIAGTVTIKIKGGANFGSNVLVTDIVVDNLDPAYSGTTIAGSGQTPHDPDGVFSWIKSQEAGDTDIFGSEGVAPLALADYPFLNSLVRDMVAVHGSQQPLSNSMLTRYVGAFEYACQDVELTDLLTTEFCMNQYREGFDNQVVYQGQGQALSINAGYETDGEGDDVYIPFTSPKGRRYKLRGNAFMPPGTLVGVKGAGNIFEVQAPELGGKWDNSLGAGDLEFIAPMHGSNSIWLGTQSGDRWTNSREAPAEAVYCHVCDDPRSLLLSNLLELKA